MNIFKHIAKISVLSMTLTITSQSFACEQPQLSSKAYYDYVDCLEDGLALVVKADKYGFVNQTGKVIIPLQYDDASHFSEGLARVEKNTKYGFIDQTGKVIIPFQYDVAWDFREGLVGVGKSGKWGFIDKKGKMVIPLQYDYVSNFFSDGVIEVEQDGEKFFINQQGQRVQ